MLDVLMMIIIGVLLADSQPAGQKVFKVPVDLVLTHAFVIDANQRPITGLQAQDFVIADEGIPQQIAHFKPETEPFRVLIGVDTSGSAREKIDIIRSAAKRFLKQLGAGDEVAIMEFGDRVRLVQGMTRDRNALERALENIGRQASDHTKLHDAVAFALRVAFKGTRGRNALVLLTDGVDNGSGIEPAALSQYLGEADCLIYPLVVDTQKEYGLYVRQRLRTEGRFALILDARSDRNDRKVLEAARFIVEKHCETSYIWLLERNCHGGQPVLTSSPTSCEELWKRLPHQRPSAQWRLSQGKALVDPTMPFFVVTDTTQGLSMRVDPCVLLPARVLDLSHEGEEWKQMIPNFLGGLEPVRSLRSELESLPQTYANARENMNTMATVTGGRAYQLESLKQLDQFYELVAQELRCVYTLGFYPSQSGTPGFHSLKVESRRPGLAVRARSVYWR